MRGCDATIHLGFVSNTQVWFLSMGAYRPWSSSEWSTGEYVSLLIAFFDLLTCVKLFRTIDSFAMCKATNDRRLSGQAEHLQCFLYRGVFGSPSSLWKECSANVSVNRNQSPSKESKKDATFYSKFRPTALCPMPTFMPYSVRLTTYTHGWYIWKQCFPLIFSYGFYGYYTTGQEKSRIPRLPLCSTR